ncbi:hypothetical protein [Curtobacterium luteum]|uniref:Uncharacterized protein n=1 Tax=Curtobacterium luteum TaxID=33881 RepID=A0A175RY77_9MICO|nr:hypothetical protein [Curtobacterium luteum]KTR08363.1 hypothetical protein NS184_05940 [Curtobacterium luteum]
MFRLGCSVFRRHAGDVFDRARVRRAVAIAAAAFAVSVVALSGLEARLGWTGTGPVRSAVAIALLALGVGLLTFGCIPTRHPLDPAATINGRPVRVDLRFAARPTTKRYLRRRAVPVAPEDRDAVLTDTLLLRRGLIALIGRAGPLLGAGVAAACACVVTAWTQWFPLLWVVGYAFSIPGTLADLGRTERARLAALAAPEPAPTD